MFAGVFVHPHQPPQQPRFEGEFGVGRFCEAGLYDWWKETRLDDKPFFVF